MKLKKLPVADSGFARRGGGGVRCQPMSLGQKPVICQYFFPKLHEKERNWTERWAEHAPRTDTVFGGGGRGGGEKSHDLIAARLAGTNVCYVLSSGV